MIKTITFGIVMIMLSSIVFAEQVSFPDSDLNNDDNYGITPLWSKIDDKADVDEIKSPLLTTPKNFNVTTSDVDNPISNLSKMHVNIVVKEGASGGQAVTIDWKLLDGDTTIATHSVLTSTTYQNKGRILTLAEGQSINNFSNLIIDIEGTGDLGLPRDRLFVRSVWIGVSDVIPFPGRLRLRGDGLFQIRGDSFLELYDSS